MANGLTGDFDIVVEVSTGAVNRVLAAMHACERFPHSISVRIDDTVRDPKFPRPTVVGAIDGLGEALADHTRVGNPVPLSGAAAASAARAGLDVLVNGGLVAVDPPPVPSLLKGVAQLQLFPPTLDVTQSMAGSITVRQEMMSRYFPDKNTSALAEFVRGELQITAAVNNVISQNANMVNINFKADQAYINFTPSFSSTPLSAEDLAAINLVIKNGLKTSFLPSSSPLGSQIASVQFKTLTGPQNALGLLLTMAGNSAHGNAASVNSLFLGNDDLAFAAGSDFIHRVLYLSKITDHRNSYYDFSIDPSLSLENGRIVLKFAVQAKGKHWYTPDLSGTVTQAFTLTLVSAQPGDPLNTAELALDGDISVAVDDLPDFVADPFKTSLRQLRDEQVAAQQPVIRSMLNIETNLGKVLRPLLNPSQPGAQPQPDVNFVLAYTSVGIAPDGVSLRGSVSVSNWPAAHIEYEQIPGTSSGPLGNVTVQPPDYSALKTWIPGGTVTQYEWSPNGRNYPSTVEQNKFVLQDAQILAPETPGYTPMCLSIGGWRLSSSGPVVRQPVSATICGHRVFPVLGGLRAAEAAGAMIALTQPTPDGRIEVTGHTSVALDLSGQFAPNTIVHFANGKGASQLQTLLRCLRDSGRKDTQTAILAVLSTEQMRKAPHVSGITYADNHNGAWHRAFAGGKPGEARTLIVSPGGKTLWEHTGEITSKDLTPALQKHLVAGAVARHSVILSGLRPGGRAPNFLLDGEGGLTLRKLKGQATVLIFWRSDSGISIEAVQSWQKGKGNTVVLAVNGGESAETARRIAKEHGFAVELVTDPKREIAQAYGIRVWPTAVMLSASGSVTSIRLGHDITGAQKDSKPTNTRA